MAKVKIISNPYEKKISFQCWNQNKGWTVVGTDNDKDSQLLNEKITGGFFPFKAEEIVKTIIEEYAESHDPTELVFEGTEDEYEELKLLCEDSVYKPYIKLMNLKKRIQNADLVFGEIKSLFSEQISKILESIEVSDQMQNECAKYADASNDRIPICVVGNYSTGKSTFINALIGNELLASDVKTSTAWNYKILCSPKDAYAEVHFCCEENPIDLIFDGNEWSATSEDNKIVHEIAHKINEQDENDVILRVRTALAVINRCMKDFGLTVTGAIEVKVPFKQSILMKENRNFVIFDTPGSNSASNQNHTAILKEALQGLSNGILLFVTDYDHMDGNDNEALYQSIDKMQEFDSRFTMIIVNRMDMQNGLPLEGFSENEKREILEQAIPRNLYSAGIYFVSSVMGLGAKNDGAFIDRSLKGAYSKLKRIDPDDELYRKYYMYNILPRQLEEKERKAASQCENVALADSGLFSVENRIKLFAEKYSVYNKCIQSHIFLKNVVNEISKMIQDKKQVLEQSVMKKKEDLEQQKEKLLNQIAETSQNLEEYYYNKYDDSKVKEEYIAHCKVLFEDFLEEIFRASQEQSEIAQRKEKCSQDNKWLFVKGVVQGIDDVRLNNGYWMTPTDKRYLIVQANMVYKNDARKVQEILNRVSRKYWGIRTEKIKTELISIIVGSEVLTDENKDILKDIIMSYEQTEFQDYSEEVFAAEFLKQRNAEALKKQLKENYDIELEKGLQPICSKIKDSHAKSFNEWCGRLQKEIEKNIEVYSPELQVMVKEIEEEEQKFKQIEEKQHRIEACAEKIKAMMEWSQEE